MQTHFDAYFLRAEREHQGRAWLAWTTVALDRTKRLPPMSDLVGKQTRRRQGQTWQEQRDVARMLTVLYGGTIVERASDGG